MRNGGLILRVRDMILSGEIKPGTRITEAGLAELLKVSRTPIRNILPALEKEGLLKAVGKRGFSVSKFSIADSIQALEIRSVIEGLAARLHAMQGLSPETEAILRECLDKGDTLFAKRHLTPDDEQSYAEINEKFHQTIVSSLNSPLFHDIYERTNIVPFVAPNSLAFRQFGHEKAFLLLYVAHTQHHAIFEAILSKDATRAEALFREHAFTQRHSIKED